MAKDPAALLYIDKWIAATQGMKGNAKGWFLDLILYQYDKGSLPNDLDELASICRIRPSEYNEFEQVFKQVLEHKFEQNVNGTLENAFAKEILTARKAFKEKRSNSGKWSYAKRYIIKHYGNQAPEKWEFIYEHFDFSIDLKNEQVFKQMLEQIFKLYINVDVNVNENINEVREIGGVGEREARKVSRETRGIKRETEAINFTQPDVEGDELIFPVDTKPIRELWARWKKYRWEQYGARYGMMGEQADLKRLQNLNAAQIEKTILTAIANNWKNLYPEHNGTNGIAKTKQQRNIDALQAGWIARNVDGKGLG